MRFAGPVAYLSAVLICQPVLAEDLVLDVWGDGRSCASLPIEEDPTPPRHAVPLPWFIGEGRIERGSTFCLLTDGDGHPVEDEDLYSGTHHAHCTLGSEDDTRAYTIAMMLEDNALTMIWTVIGPGPAYPAKIGPLSRCDGRPHSDGNPDRDKAQ